MTDELQHKIFKIIEKKPATNQRDLSVELGISLGKVNYCIRALCEKGWVKANNFRNNRNKLSYAYILTPSGLEQKASVTLRYLKKKMQEYDELRDAVEELKKELRLNES